MDQPDQQGVEIFETDIVFNCPYCAKSLAIDERGAGLMIACTDCGRRIRVPYREELEEQRGSQEPDTSRVETGDVVSAGEQQAGSENEQLHYLRDRLTKAEARIEDLTEEYEALRKRRDYLEGVRVSHMTSIEKLREELGVMQSALDRMVDILQDSRQIPPGFQPKDS